MYLDFLADPTLAERWQIIDAETGEVIEHVAWVDTEAGTYATVRRRPRTFTDKREADLRIKDAAGGYVLRTHAKPIELVDLTVSPLKRELLALLDDPDVVAKIQAIVAP